MSYRTVFQLTIQEGGPTTEEVARYLSDHGRPAVMRNLETPDTWELILTSGLDIAWHDNQDDMKRVSRHWPKVLFTLTGQGDDSGDTWTQYYQGGKVQLESAPRWRPPAFDPKLLR